jgi:hypothetical protein
MNRERLLRSLYILFLCAVVGVAAELAARLYLARVLQRTTTGSKFQFDSYRVFAHRPGYQEGDGRLVINAQGFRRAADVAKAKPAGTYRVFLMGGSAAHGMSSAAPYPIRHLRMDETIDAQLERLLAAALPGRRIEVINAAVTGYQVFQHTSYLLAELLDYDPDAVVFFDGANDHYVTEPYYDQYAAYPYQFWRDRLQNPSASGIGDYTALWLSRWSAVARVAHAWRIQRDAVRKADEQRMKRASDLDAATLAAWNREAAPRGFLRSVEVNLMLLRRSGVDAVVCLQPMLALRDARHLSAAERGFLRPDETGRKIQATVVQQLTELTDRYAVPFVDVNTAFDGATGQQLFIDYCHLSPEGSAVAARSILPKLLPLLERRAAAKLVPTDATSPH